MNNFGKEVALAIGSNLGNRLEMLRRAVVELERHGFIISEMSRVWETAPWGVIKQPRFLNMCVLTESKLEPEDMLQELKTIEQNLGRNKTERWGPRIIDLDIVMLGDEIVDTPRLRVPHPRMQERTFVLVPLAEIAPNMVNPKLGKTIKELLYSLPEEEMDWIIKI